VARSTYGIEILNVLFIYLLPEARALIITQLVTEILFTITDTHGKDLVIHLLKAMNFPEVNRYCDVLFANALTFMS
jgi:hypothetical protein